MDHQAVPQAPPWPEGWPVPNYINPPTRGTPALFLLTLAVTAVVVALRLYSRFCITRSAGIDDIFLVAGFVFSLGQTFAAYKNLTTWGWNKHLWDVPITDHEYVRLGAWLLELFFLLGISCTKISILFVYRRISNGSSNKCFIRLTWAAIGFTVVYVLALTLYLFLICQPMDAYWKAYSPTYTKPYKCGDERVPILLSVTLNVVSDIYATVLPMFLVRKLRLSIKQRIGLVILFSVGILTVGTGTARIYFLNIVTKNYKPGPHTHDVTWPGWPLCAWTDIEAHLAIICASAPALKVIFSRKLKPVTDRVLKMSRSTISRSRSRASSSKAFIPLSNPKRNREGSSDAWNTSWHRETRRSEITHKPSKDQLEVYERDVEKFPLEQIICVREDKPLPTIPAETMTCATSVVPSSQETTLSSPHDDVRSTISIDAVSTSRASSGEFLPIFVSDSLPPVVR